MKKHGSKRRSFLVLCAVAFLIGIVWSCLANAQQARPFRARIDPSDLDSPQPYFTLDTLTPSQRRVTVHSAPQWYADESTGVLLPIEIDASATVDPIDSENAYAETRNLLRFRVNANGVATYARGPYVLRTRMIQVRVEDEATTTERKTDVALRASQFDKSSATTLTLTGLQSYLDYTVRIRRGAIKENLVINGVPDGALTDAEAVLFVWQYDASYGSSITPTIEDGRIVWRNAQDRVVFVMDAPYVYDALGRVAPSRYALRGAYYAVAVRAFDLRRAQFPVVIDPTTTTNQGAATYNRSWGEQDYGGVGLHLYDHAVALIALPDLTGLFSVIDSATFKGYTQANGGATHYASIHCDALSAGSGEGWTEATGAAALDALSFNAVTDSAVALNTTATGVTNFDALGSSGTNGIAKIYNDDQSPTDCSIKLNWTDNLTATADQVTTNLILGEPPSGAHRHEFYDRTDATYYWRLEIVYTSPSSGGSGSAGMIMGKGSETHGRNDTHG